jgi:hypothetical protein
MTSDEAAADVRKELMDFFNGHGAYREAVWGADDDVSVVDLFLERNHVVRIPEEGQLEVTRAGELIKIGGETYSSNPDQFDWQEFVSTTARSVDNQGRNLRLAVLEHERAKAVQRFLALEQEAQKAKDLEAEQRRKARADQLAQEFYGEPRADHLSLITQRVLVRLVEAEEQLAARS